MTTQQTEQSEREELMTLVERYAAYRVNADRWGNKHGDVDGSENCWRQIRAALLAEDKAGGEPVMYINPKVIDETTGKVRKGTEALTWSSRPIAGAWSLPLYTHPQPQADAVRVPEKKK